MKKIFLVVGFAFFLGDIISGVGFGHSGSGYLTLGPTAMKVICSSFY